MIFDENGTKMTPKVVSGQWFPWSPRKIMNAIGFLIVWNLLSYSTFVSGALFDATNIGSKAKKTVTGGPPKNARRAPWGEDGGECFAPSVYVFMLRLDFQSILTKGLLWEWKSWISWKLKNQNFGHVMKLWKRSSMGSLDGPWSIIPDFFLISLRSAMNFIWFSYFFSWKWPENGPKCGLGWTVPVVPEKNHERHRTSNPRSTVNLVPAGRARRAGHFFIASKIIDHLQTHTYAQTNSKCRHTSRKKALLDQQKQSEFPHSFWKQIISGNLRIYAFSSASTIK